MEVTRRFLEYKIQSLRKKIEDRESIGYKCRADEKELGAYEDILLMLNSEIESIGGVENEK
ncbi:MULTISPECIES: hypothetical protein [unclassified Clostridioides]|uniref:hypothetical protein n=1 Tax=unclassified Clostridioides TaxID=2635829 RepID=UPI001D110BC7|nr:hypothetical protein [Clostridioides sp. ES-S-0001-02]MCC0671590.1 hypothetical protein [Clostridioides sp. ES-S-0145-01]